MCGIAGFLDFRRRFGEAEQQGVCLSMGSALAHRGPDDQGAWTDAKAGIALGHRRLSILDLTASGHQPMRSASGRYVITYNGELYNFESLRRELAGYPYRGRSDTEVILAAVDTWGLEASLRRFDGMFAFAMWDGTRRVLHLARDRFGEKPLYYGMSDGALLFASEMKALRRFPGHSPAVDRGSVAQLLRYGYIPAPRSISAGIGKLPPATFLTIETEGDATATPVAYWSYERAALEARAKPFRGSEEEAISELDAVLRRVIASRMVSDVPIGAFLSGGIDSSTVVALLQASTAQTARTFTIGFDEPAYNEADAAKRVANHLGTRHTELYVTSDQAREVIPRLASLYDEPFADASQIPTFLVASLARQQVTVALSGDGGDELFGGYNRYVWAEAIWRRVRHIPPRARRMLARGLHRIPPSAVDASFAPLRGRFRDRLSIRNPGDKLQKVAGLLRLRDANELYFDLVSTWKTTSVVLDGMEPPHPVLQTRPPHFQDLTERMMCSDAITYLPDDILTKVDRAAMGVGLETRVPLLSPDVVALAWSFPRGLKVRDQQGKWILRQVLARYVPPALFERPKMGFGVPIDRWLRGPLRPWAEDLLAKDRLKREGFFDAAVIRQRWEEHLSGRTNWQYALWHVLIFQSWLASRATG